MTIGDSDENVSDLNDMRRVRNIEKAVKLFETQLADLKKATTLMSKHSEFRFFSILCHDLVEQQKLIAQELLKLRVRLDKYKNSLNKEN